MMSVFDESSTREELSCDLRQHRSIKKSHNTELHSLDKRLEQGAKPLSNQFFWREFRRSCLSGSLLEADTSKVHLSEPFNQALH
jgi:hypothetical protein